MNNFESGFGNKFLRQRAKGLCYYLANKPRITAYSQYYYDWLDTVNWLYPVKASN